MQPEHDDVECGPISFQRIVLTVGGLKCGCCGDTGIAKALCQIPAARYGQVNIVLARVEFELDISRFSEEDAISHLTKTTGYSFARFEVPVGQTLDLFVSDVAEIQRAGRPYGVQIIETLEEKPSLNPAWLFGRHGGEVIPTSIASLPDDAPNNPKFMKVSTLREHKVRIHYNATQIGARDVFEYYQQLAPSQNLRLAAADAQASIATGLQETKRACIQFIVTLILTVPVLVFSWAQFNGLEYAHSSLVLATVVQVIAIREFFPNGLRTLIHSKLFNMDFLIALSTTMAYIFSVISYVYLVKRRPLETGSFFETSTLLIVLILLGRMASEFARLKAAKSISFRSLQANHALLLVSGRPIGPASETRQIDSRLLQYGDIFKVLPHTKIVTDGKVIYGGSEVDESMITGETIPVAKGLDHTVHAGTVNGTGHLIVSLTTLPHENSISKIASMVENAELSKPRVQDFADQVADWFVPTMAAIGILVFLIWIFLSKFHFHLIWSESAIRATTYTIATLIVSCPCAIGLAVPMVILIAGGVSARFGIIFRDPQKLEIARNVTDVVFDKTGTLTTGDMEVVDAEILGPHKHLLRSVTLALLEGDAHPTAQAVVEWLVSATVNEEMLPEILENVTNIPGSGVTGVLRDKNLEIRAGNPHWLGLSVLDTQDTLFCVEVSGVHTATFRLSDRTRPSTEGVIRLLTNRGISVHMISGDGEGAVSELAHTIGITKSRTRWRHKPDEKQRYVQDLQKTGKIVLFCGDGTNDSVALKQADVGVHFNDGSDVAKCAADVVLVAAQLYDLVVLLDISAAAYIRIMLNFAWSFIYNFTAILMAAGAFVRVRIEPKWAGLGELVSVLPVVFIAFQLRWVDFGRQYRHVRENDK